MKKIVFVALAMLMAISGCKAGEQAESQAEKTTGKMVKETRQVGKFNGIALIGSCKVICTLDSTRSVVVEAPKEVRLLTEVKDGVLTISREKIAGVRVLTQNTAEDKATVYVTMPTLQSVKLIGSGDVIVKGKVASDDKLNVSLSGSGDIEMSDVDVKFANFSLAGSGDIKIGTVKSKQADMTLAGSGDIKAGIVDADGAKIALAGSGDVYVDQVKASNVTVSSAGSGDMDIDKVDCAVLTVNQTSSSDVTIRNLKAVTTNVNKTGSGDVKIAGKTNYYNERKLGSGEIKKSSLKYDNITQTRQGGLTTVSKQLGTLSPNGIEPEP